MIYTVTGAVEKETLGVTLSHEHLVWDTRHGKALYLDKIYDAEEMDHLYHQLLPVLKKMYGMGCRTIVETSPPEGGQNLKLMQKLSLGSGIKIIANTGMIYSDYALELHEGYSERDLSKRWVQDFYEGLDTLNNVVIRPNQIKIFISRGELTELEKKMLKAAVWASKETGMLIHCHIFEAKTVEEVIRFLERIHCDFSKFLWAHAGYEGNISVIEKAYSKGCWIGLDRIRQGNYDVYYTLLKLLIEKGYQSRILLSQDYDFYEEVTLSKNMPACLGLFTEFIPYCVARGLSKSKLIKMLTENPANFFDISKRENEGGQ